jgi:hypothetical protein
VKSTVKHVACALLAASFFLAVSVWASPLKDARAPAVPPVAEGELEGARLDMTCAQLLAGIASAEAWKDRALAATIGLDPCNPDDASGCPVEWAVYRAAWKVGDALEDAYTDFCLEA